MLKAKDLRDVSVDELKLKAEELRRELFLQRSEAKQTKKNDNLHLIRTKRRDVARVLTVLREKGEQ